MIFTIGTQILIDNLLTAQKALSTKTPNPVLTGVKLETKTNHLIITTCNSDISIKITVTDKSLKVEEQGDILIPGKYFIEIIKKIEEENVKFAQIEETILNIEAGRSHVSLNLMEINDYPKIDFTTNDEGLKIKPSVIKNIIRQTTIATSINENRPLLTGVNFNLNKNKLVCTATDSYRLSKKSIELNSKHDKFDIIIPGKSLEELIKIIDNDNENITMYLEDNKTIFEYKNIYFKTRLLEGIYPQTSRLIPESVSTSIDFDREDLIKAVETASLLSSRDGNNSIVKMKLKNDKSVEISSNSPEIGKVEKEIYPVGEVIGNSITIAFSSKYFLDAIKTFSSNEINIGFTGETKPFVLTGDKDKDMLQLILPVRID